MVLSTPSSVLLDASFGQSCYDGLVAFYKDYNINLPYTNSTELLIKLIKNSDANKKYI
ncbi:MAG: BMP family protein [Ureaplasma sp.]|nr:BMP family protein [Ureaplasma sp.]